MPAPEWDIVLSLGLMLSVAVLGALAARLLRLPRVTAYLLIGMLLGPHTLALVSEEHLHHLMPVGKLAMALVLFYMGSHFTLAELRRVLPRVMRLSSGELSLTFLLVAGGVLGLGLLGLEITWQYAVLLGVLALATAPATTILVLKENESEGPLTEYATALVAINNLVAIVGFELLFLAIHFFGAKLAQPIAFELRQLLVDLVGSVLLGGVVGILLSYCCGLLPQRNWLVLLVAATTLVLGLCEFAGIPYLLAFLAMGAVVANASDRARQIAGELEPITGLLCVVFFVIHGAELNLQKLGQIGLVGVAYIALRTAGKYFGIFLAAGRKGEDSHVRPWLGATLLSQAGAAIALSNIAVSRDPDLGRPLQTIILGTVVVFELVGPVLIRVALIRSGEVPLGQAIRHATTTPWEELRNLVNRLRIALGLDPWRHRPPQSIVISDLMRTTVQGIAASASFDELVDHIEHSLDNTFAVVGPQGQLLGVIRYPELRDSLFDPELGALVRAADLAVPARHVLRAGDTLARAQQMLLATADDVLPVISDEEEPRLVGIVRRKDLLRFFIPQKNS